MVIRHQYRYSQIACRLHPGDAGHAVVDGHDQGGLARCRQRHDFRGEPVTETESIGHEKIDMCEVHGT